MLRAALVALCVILLASNTYLWVSLSQLEESARTTNDQLNALSSESKRNRVRIFETTKLVSAAAHATPTAQTPTHNGAATAPRGSTGELALAESYKVDRVVEWMSLIEDKIYFLLFPPPEGAEKDRQALELRDRTEQVRAAYQAAAQHELIMRERLLERLQETKNPQPAR